MGHRVGGGQDAGRQRGDQVPVGAHELLDAHALAVEDLLAQLLGPATRLGQHLVATPDHGGQGLLAQGGAHPGLRLTVVLHQVAVRGRVEGVEPGAVGELLEEPQRLVLGAVRAGGHQPGAGVVVGAHRPVGPVQGGPVALQLGAQCPEALAVGCQAGRVHGPGVQAVGRAQGVAHLGGPDAVVVEVEQERADAGLLAQSAGNDVERRLLLRHEHNGLTGGQGPEDEVGDRLGLARPWRPLHHEAVPGHGLGHDPGLGGVGGQGQVLDDGVEAGLTGGHPCRVGEVVPGGLNEVGHQWVGGEGAPGVLQVLPHPVGGEAEQPEVDGGGEGDLLVLARLVEPEADRLHGGVHVNAVPVPLRVDQLGELDAGVGLEAGDQGVVRGGDHRLVRGQDVALLGEAEGDRDEDER